MDWNTRNIQTYDESASRLAEYFAGIGARTDDIDRAFELAQVDQDARVVEIGCGDGRDAAEIVKRASWYEGFDPSTGMLDIARHKISDVSFVVADALTYDYPDNIDIVFAFASLLHASKSDMPAVINKISDALRMGGIFYVSLKERNEYTEEVKSDVYGERMFYYYNSTLFKQMCETMFDPVHEDHQTMGDTDWFTLGLKKI